MYWMCKRKSAGGDAAVLCPTAPEIRKDPSTNLSNRR
jgi:hypothetical protein